MIKANTLIRITFVILTACTLTACTSITSGEGTRVTQTTEPQGGGDGHH